MIQNKQMLYNNQVLNHDMTIIKARNESMGSMNKYSMNISRINSVKLVIYSEEDDFLCFKSLCLV